MEPCPWAWRGELATGSPGHTSCSHAHRTHGLGHRQDIGNTQRRTHRTTVFNRATVCIQPSRPLDPLVSLHRPHWRHRGYTRPRATARIQPTVVLFGMHMACMTILDMRCMAVPTAARAPPACPSPARYLGSPGLTPFRLTTRVTQAPAMTSIVVHANRQSSFDSVRRPRRRLHRADPSHGTNLYVPE